MSTPRATYRLQFHRQFGFRDAAALAPYLSRLGISHIYASPYLRARPGSTHGYDIVAHDQLNPELGNQEDFQYMVNEFRAHGLKQIADIVPNHMGVGGSDNPLWLDVLEWGEQSAYAGWFDIDWDPNNRYLQGKLLTPVLADQYGLELESGKLQLKFDAQQGEFAVWVYETHKLPICPLHYEMILGDEAAELQDLGDDFSALPEWHPQMTQRAMELKQQLAQVAMNSALSLALQRRVEFFNRATTAGELPQLDKLIQRQHWRVTHFRVAGDDINYRRFFNINDLAGVRVELPEVFAHVHRLPLQLVHSGVLDGLRIDHIDGLLDPAGYLQRLREALAVDGDTEAQPYVVVEKILSEGEQLPRSWPVAGTTGYDFCNLVLAWLMEPRGTQALSVGYENFCGERQRFASVVHASKIQIMNYEMAGELNVLARDAARVARQSPRTADFTRNLLWRALRQLIACLPVYRSYVDAQGTISPAESQLLTRAIALARRREPQVDASVFIFLERLLNGGLLNPRGIYTRHTVVRCARKVQQYSGPVMAKGLEDTAFYRYQRCVALNEVGGNPECMGLSMAEFHAANRQRLQEWPDSMLTTSTHDTKRGEDARARLAALSELADEWTVLTPQWREALSGGIEVSPPDIYLLFQQLLGSWPYDCTPQNVPLQELQQYRERLAISMRKAVREAKLNSNWAAPNDEYEQQLLQLVDEALLPPQCMPLWQTLGPFLNRLAELGMCNSLSQLVLKMTVPGMPDTFQGSELWNFDLVDPDNRRAVDYTQRQTLLRYVIADGPSEHSLRTYRQSWRDGRLKLALAYQLLLLRRALPSLFMRGEYLPLHVQGEQAECLCAFARQDAQHCVVVIANRFSRRAPAWQDVQLHWPPNSPAAFTNIFTGEVFSSATALRLDAVLNILPVAVLSAAPVETS